MDARRQEQLACVEATYLRSQLYALVAKALSLRAFVFGAFLVGATGAVTVPWHQGTMEKITGSSNSVCYRSCAGLSPATLFCAS